MGLKQVFAPYFYIGAAIPGMAVDRLTAVEEIKKQYSSITCENDMKPEQVLDKAANQADPEKYGYAPALDFTKAKKTLDFCKENGIAMRGHTLVWHHQTPEWFFHEDFDTEKPLMNRENMIRRMDGYIQGVLEYVDTNYPGQVYAWDVTNEAILENGIRESLWTQTVGDDYVLQAFRAAKKYAAEGVRLFYNDYETFLPWKREKIVELILKPLLAEGLVDGMGMQAHMTMADPDLKEFQISLETFGALVKEVHVTELDIHNNNPSDYSQKMLAKRYHDLFTILVNAKKNGTADITCVTFWGLKDDWSWLTAFRKEQSYPLLFDETFKPKAAYWSVVNVPSQVEGDTEDRLPHGQRFAFWETEVKVTRELHVDCNAANACDDNDGSAEKPFKTIQAAAEIAGPGTRVLIHKGEYRETVKPRKGGDGPDSMVIYEAYNGEEVIIKASELMNGYKDSIGWNLQRFGGDIDISGVKVYETKIDPTKYLGYNPFNAINMIHDRLFIEYDKTDMLTYLNRRGMVFCDGKPLLQVPLYCNMAEHDGTYWVESNGMTVHFRLPGDDSPENHVIELTCREQCFAPEEPFLNYIKVKGLTCAHAATGAPVPQRGAISAFRGHHWIIENCIVDWSNCVGIDIGNECWHHSRIEDQTIGYAVIRGCQIREAGVCGLAGLFADHLLIEDNLFTGTGWQKMELSWEAGAIKVHNCIDSMIRRNIFTETLRADHLWMDVGNENNRITGNLFLNGREQREAIFIECSRNDVNLIDNNIFWNVEGRFDPAKVPVEPGSTGWYKMSEYDVVNGYAVYGEGTDHLLVVNNLMGKIRSAGYFEKPTGFRFGAMGNRGGTSRDAVIANNIFYDSEAAIKFPTRDNRSEGNVYSNMRSGAYLRVLNPAPQTNLDLQAWQEFYGFDIEGQEARFDIEMDTENYTLTFKKGEDFIPMHPGLKKLLRLPASAENLVEVSGYEGIQSDFFGNFTAERRIPGPFGSIVDGQAISVDPRKIH